MPTAEQQSFVTSDGTRLALYRQGPLEAPLSIVLAHGWVLDSRIWEPIADELSSGACARSVLRYDLRGHGHSDPALPGTATIDQLADDLAGLLSAEVEGPVVLGGHSMGGMAILALAQRHPELVAQRVVGVILAATSCGELMPLDLGVRPALARALARVEASFNRWASRSRWLLGREVTTRRPGSIRSGVRWLLFGKRPRRADVELTASCVAHCRPASLVTFRATFDDYDQAAALAAFRYIPTLVIGGTRDRLTPIRHTEKIAAELPDATMVRYEGAGHMVLLERAEQVASRIGELVTAVEAGRRLPAE
jgi:pimeloyl-ACP methyl ester carboxylesterase